MDERCLEAARAVINPRTNSKKQKNFFPAEAQKENLDIMIIMWSHFKILECLFHVTGAGSRAWLQGRPAALASVANILAPRFRLLQLLFPVLVEPVVQIFVFKSVVASDMVENVVVLQLVSKLERCLARRGQLVIYKPVDELLSNETRFICLL